MHSVVLKHELLLGVLIKIFANPPMFNFNLVLCFIKLPLDHFEAVVKIRLDDILVVVNSVQVNSSFNHFLKFSQAVVAFPKLQ